MLVKKILIFFDGFYLGYETSLYQGRPRTVVEGVKKMWSELMPAFVLWDWFDTSETMPFSAVWMLVGAGGEYNRIVVCEAAAAAAAVGEC